MSPEAAVLEAVVLVMAGFAAGTVNALVGSGTLITFPTLVVLGYPPVTANVTSGLALVPGSVAAALTHRRVVRPHRRLIAALLPCAALGAALGALLLLLLPSAAFEFVVPVLIAVAVLLVVAGPTWARRRSRGIGHDGRGGHRRVLMLAIVATSMYGGYFGAAQGVLVLGVLAATTTLGVHESNGVKNVISAVVNFVAALAYMIVGTESVVWSAVACIGLGATAGGVLGARLGGALSAPMLRGLVVVVGVISVTAFVVT